MLKIGDRVQRNLEGMWFSGLIQDISHKEKLITLKYLDDDNVEQQVPFDEIRKYSQECKDNNENEDYKSNRLLRPLAGLVEDDYEIRNSHQPTIYIHDNYSTVDEKAIILNGAENKLAAGGGLRALRYLKK
jgi:hypothetical protein